MDKNLLSESSAFKLLLLKIAFLSVIIIGIIIAKFIDKDFSSEINSFYQERLSQNVSAEVYIE